MIQYKIGYKYVLAEDYTIETAITPHIPAVIDNWVILDTRGKLTIKKGYAWDGASGPAVDTRTIMRASLVHDALYQLMREGALSIEWFEESNNLFHTICTADGMSWMRAWYAYKAVSQFGMVSISTEKSIRTAP